MGLNIYKRKCLLIVGCSFLLTLSPALTSATVFAADNDTDHQNEGDAKSSEHDDTDLPDASDIEEGTMINGEDISELSDEELQYVPEAARDGSGGDSHPNADENRQSRSISTFGITSKKSYPDVNRYISKHKLPEKGITIDHKSVLPKFNYRGGYGKPEGVVAHETANNRSTLDSEIKYMLSNYNNAFVHAFVDDQSVREIHPTDRGAWGAGRYANERFIHIELVRTHSFDAFARSINNYANYIAGLLDKYNLGVSTASSDGSGSLWAHHDVTKYLGGTTHTDPIGYFNKWGYSWDEFVDLVQKKYDDMNQTIEIDWDGQSKVGGLKSNSTKIHPNLIGYFDRPDKVLKAGEKYTDKLFYVSQKGIRNGETYYLISNKPSRTEGKIGWVFKKDITLYDQPAFKGQPTTFKLKDSAITYDKPYPTSSYIAKKSDAYAGSYVDIKGTRKVGKHHTWHQGEIDGQEVWIRDRDVSDNSLTHFPDVSTSSAHYDSIYELTSRNVIDGVPQDDGTYRFKQWKDVTRNQAAKIFTNELDLPVPDDLNNALQAFEDVDPSDAYSSKIAATYAEDIFEGSEGKFKGNSHLNREQMASIIVNAYDLEDIGTDPDINLNKVSDVHRNNVKILAQHGITDVKNGDFRSWDYVTRGQFVSFVNRATAE